MAQAPTPRQRGTKTFLKRGTDAMQALKQEQAKAEANRAAGQNRGPMRFYVGKDARGGYTEHELVFLDDDLTQAPFAYEHTIAGPGNDWSKARNFVCVDEFDDCALCRAAEQGVGEEFTPARYGMYATVLDMTPYTVKKGTRAGEVIEYTRKLMVIPHQQAGQFLKMAELCKAQNGTTRGMVVVVTKTQQTDARCGIPQMLDNGMLFDFMPEDELDDYANDEVRRDNKVVKAEGEDIEPLEYDKLLAPLDQKAIRALFNLPAPPGSEEEEQANTGTSRRARRRRVVDGNDGHQDAGEGEGQEDEVENPPPATTAASGRTRRTAAAAAPPPAAEPETPRRRRRSGGAGDDIPFEG